ncbi:MAG: outer membrane beta-barrel protein [Candidatus Azobacteroides sp.]|nr:outer membrane beta-barrel protein [Candidatus Azobacteroides sp.]
MKIFGNILFFVFFCTLSAYSQTGLTLSGTLIEKGNSEPILSGSVELLRAKDSAYVDGTLSNVKGEFIFRNLKPDRYILKISYIGFKTLFKNISLSENEPVTRLGELFMETNEILLKETVVEGKRPEIIVKNDTLEYDAGTYKTGDNDVVEDLLKKLPGVDVDKDGKITAQGKSVNRMYVNGKEFFTDDPQIASKNVPAEMIDKVQIYDRKSEMAQMTGFDLGDEETVINLTVRSNMMQGTIGTVQLGAGQDVQDSKEFRYNENAFVNHQRGSDRYTLIARANNNNNMGGADITGGGGSGGGGGARTGGTGGGGGIAFSPPGISQSQNYMANINKEFSPKLNLNGDIRYSKQERNTLSDVTQINFAERLTQQETINQNNTNSGNNIVSNLRIDWKPNERNTLIFRPNIRFNQTRRNGEEFDKRVNLDTDSVMLDSKSFTSSHGNTSSFGGTLDYSLKFSKTGRVFSINMTGNYNNNYSQPKNITYDLNLPDSLYSIIRQNQIAENKNLTDNIQATVSYVEPIGHNNFIQLLYRYSFSKIEGKNSTYDISTSLGLTELDTANILPGQSRTIMRNVTDQRIGINFKAERKKFSLTFGFNVDPSNATNDTYQPTVGRVPSEFLSKDFTGKLPLIKGDSLISSIPIDVINYSPMVNFRYNFDQRSNLRINYEGETNQPTAEQLRDYPNVDIDRPNDITFGNPNLKPGYVNNLRIEFNKYVAATQLMYRFMVSGNYNINDIITVTQVQDLGRGNLMSYKNVNGNWSALLTGMFNKPLSKKFSIGNTLMIRLTDDNSFVGDVKNTMKNRMIGDNLNFKFQPNENLYIGMNGMINYNDVTYSAVEDRNQNIYNYASGANILWTFFPRWTFESDINCNWRSGYPVGYNVSQILWNAAVTRQIFKMRSGTGSLKFQMYDILQDRKNISAVQTASDLQFSSTNVIPSYFMASFIYRFSIFPKSSFLKEGDMAPVRMREGGSGGRYPGGRRAF